MPYQPISLCIFCGNHPQSYNHIFLSCDFARRVWGLLCTALLSHPGLCPFVPCGKTGGQLLYLECFRRFGISVFKLSYGQSRVSATQGFFSQKCLIASDISQLALFFSDLCVVINWRYVPIVTPEIDICGTWQCDDTCKKKTVVNQTSNT